MNEKLHYINEYVLGEGIFQSDTPLSDTEKQETLYTHLKRAVDGKYENHWVDFELTAKPFIKENLFGNNSLNEINTVIQDQEHIYINCIRKVIEYGTNKMLDESYKTARKLDGKKIARQPMLDEMDLYR